MFGLRPRFATKGGLTPLKNVDGDLDVDGAGAVGREVRERGVDRLDGVVGVGRRARPRDERVHRGALVLALVQEAGVAALDAGGHRGREDQDRDGVGVGGRRGRGRVDHAGTGRCTGRRRACPVTRA